MAGTLIWMPGAPGKCTLLGLALEVEVFRPLQRKPEPPPEIPWHIVAKIACPTACLATQCRHTGLSASRRQNKS